MYKFLLNIAFYHIAFCIAFFFSISSLIFYLSDFGSCISPKRYDHVEYPHLRELIAYVSQTIFAHFLISSVVSFYLSSSIIVLLLLIRLISTSESACTTNHSIRVFFFFLSLFRTHCLTLICLVRAYANEASSTSL